MPLNVPFRRRTLATVIAALCGTVPVSAQAATRAGKVDFAVGDVIATDAAGAQRDVGKGSPITVGDTIETRSGRAWLRFRDGGYMSLQPGTEFRVDDYHFEGEQDGSEKSFFSLLRGGMRAITGIVGRKNRASYRVNTPVATIGIRGTEYLAQLGESLTLSCGEGVCVVTNDAGEVVMQAGQTMYFKDRTSPPQQMTRRVSLPPNAPVQFAGGEFRENDGSLATLPEPPLPEPDEPYVFSDDVPLVEGENPGTFLGLSYGGDGAEFGSFGQDFDTLLITGDGPDRVTSELDDNFILQRASWNPSISFDESCCSPSVPMEFDTDGVIAWGRWTYGLAESEIFDNDGELWLEDGNQSVHWYTGVPTPEEDLLNLKAQGVTAVYNLIGATMPTFGDDGFEGGDDFGDAVSVSGALAANFAQSTVQASIALDFTDHDVNIETGPMSILAGAGGRFGASGPLATSDVSPDPTYDTTVVGNFVGGAATRAGVAYGVYIPISGGYSINGVTVFGLGAAAGSVEFEYDMPE